MFVRTRPHEVGFRRKLDRENRSDRPQLSVYFRGLTSPQKSLKNKAFAPEKIKTVVFKYFSFVFKLQAFPAGYVYTQFST